VIKNAPQRQPGGRLRHKVVISVYGRNGSVIVSHRRKYGTATKRCASEIFAAWNTSTAGF
jgi:hypothetical protein